MSTRARVDIRWYISSMVWYVAGIIVMRTPGFSVQELLIITAAAIVAAIVITPVLRDATAHRLTREAKSPR